MQLLITRPAPDAQALLPHLIAQGHKPLLLPLLNIVFDKTASLPESYGALAFTSANGVRALYKNNNKCLNVPIFTIGSHTQQAVLEFMPDKKNIFTCAPDANSVAELAAMIIAQKDTINGAVAHIVGRHQAGDLVSQLKAAGQAAQKYVLYEAQPTKDFDKKIASAIITYSTLQSKPQGVLLYSRRSADLFLDYWQKNISAEMGIAAQKNYRAFCLSPALADYMNIKGFTAHAATAPTQAAMLDLLAKEAQNEN